MACFKKHADKNWEYRIRYKDPITGKHRVKSQRGFSSIPEAKLAAEDMERKIREGFSVNKQILLKNFLNDWLYESKNPRVRKNTFQTHKNSVENHIVPYFKNIRLDELNLKLYKKFLNHLVGQGLSKRKIEIIHGTMYNANERGCD